MIRQYELIERVKAYDPQVNEDALSKAYAFSMKAHSTQTRASGDPYFSHPLEVAGILTQMKLDWASIATGLLHDTVEDTLATLEEIEKLFGPEIARLVDGVTKLSRIELQSDQEKQAENFRKLVLAMSEDIRVLLVKLADRLHNMRTLYHISNEDKRRRIARETLEIYAPLAERIGIHRMKDELEDLAFQHLYPEGRESIVSRLSFLRASGSNAVQRIVEQMTLTLAEGGLTANITGREKAPYSIWRKMQRKNMAFEQLSDIMAFRIIVNNLEQCYQALGIIHARYPVVPGRFKDYISTPKPNGYRSIHTCVIGPERQRIEIQIRTHDMHEISELGVAAHWAYKQQGSPKTDGKQYRWLRELLDILEHAQKPEEFLEHTKMELFQDQVFCFTPRGDLIALPRGACPVDFAYAVHTQVGDTCVGSKVNGRMVPLRTELHNGDQVEIVTSKTQTPSPTWERFVITGKAKACIRRFIRTEQRAQYATLGKGMLQKLFKQEGYDFTEKALENILKTFQATLVEDIYAYVGSGLHSAREVFHAVFPGHKPASTEETPTSLPTASKPKEKDKEKEKEPGHGKATPLPIRGLIPGMAVHYARCCHPLPGDRIVGIVTTGRGVTIHTIDCETLETFSNAPERWLDVGWDTGDDNQPQKYVGRLNVVLTNEANSLGTLSIVIGKNNGHITNLKITHRSTDFYELLVDVEVKDVRHLANIVAALRATSAVNSVDRARGR